MVNLSTLFKLVLLVFLFFMESVLLVNLIVNKQKDEEAK
jgi:hypothetical protein